MRQTLQVWAVPGRRGLMLSWLTIAALVVLLGTQGARGEPLSVKEFNEKLEGWKAANKDPSAITVEVEGRVSVYGKDRFKLQKCSDVAFVSAVDLPERTRKSFNVVATGKVVRDAKLQTYSFHVSSVRIVPGEVEQFFERKRRIHSDSAEEWYALAQWATLRGEFYADDKLLALADEAARHGLVIERKARSRDDPERLLELAEKAKRFRMLSFAHELTHEAFHRLCEQSRKQPDEAVEALAKRLAGALPDADTKLAFFPDELIANYRHRPMDTYERADAATRRTLHRWLYAGLQMQLIERALASDGSNGFEIADRIQSAVPEQHARADEIRDQALKARAAEIEKLTRSQVVELSGKYRQRNQRREADNLVESWLTWRKQGLEPDDTEGILNLSDEYRRMLNRDDLADRLLIDGWERNPRATDLIERLEKEGYRLFNGRWLSEQEFANRPEGKLERAIRSGLVEPGMTASHVRRSRGKPDSRSRSATAGQVTELWTYKQADGSHLVVRFVRRAGQSEMAVASVVDGAEP